MATESKPIPKPALGVIALAPVALLALLALSTFDFGATAAGLKAQDWIYTVLLMGSALAVLVRACTRDEQRAAWALIGLGLALWAAGDAYYTFDLATRTSIPYPSLSDALYFGFYAALIAGVGKLGGRLKGQGLISGGLVVCLLGLATIWSLLVFKEVLTAAEGGLAAFATTLAYPLLDLVLLGSVLVAFASRGWRIEGALIPLAIGFSLLIVVDSVSAVQVAHGSDGGGPMQTLWPASALLIAAAAWIPLRPVSREMAGTRFISGLTTAAIMLAIGLLLLDHVNRLDSVSVVLASITLVAGLGQLLLLRGANTRAVSADSLRASSASVSPDCIISIDAEGSVIEWNEAASRTFGYSRDAALGRELAELVIPPESRQQHRDGLARLADGGHSPLLDNRVELTAMRASGELFPAELAVSTVQEDPHVYTGFLRDISDRRRNEQENERLAAIVRSSEDAIISKDLAGVVTGWNHGAEKLYGYSSADAVGRSVSELIVPAGLDRELDDVSEQVLAGEPVAFETRRRRKDGEMVDVSLRAFQICDVAGTVVGVATSAHDITERRLREERARGVGEGRLWRRRIEHALEADEFVFFGQPIVDIVTGKVHHKELLLRMELGDELITPDRFLPHAETCELIGRIDRWAVESGIDYAHLEPVAINLSAKSLGNREVSEAIRNAFADSSAAPSDVTFEITETAAAQNLDGARELVHELRDLGCGVAVDDFGTGYASFTYLRHLPVTELKIDIEFVREVARNTADQKIVSSMIAVAETFEMRTVAEGVEDEATLETLRGLGVDLVQGYHLGRPSRMPALPKRATGDGRVPAPRAHAGVR